MGLEDAEFEKFLVTPMKYNGSGLRKEHARLVE